MNDYDNYVTDAEKLNSEFSKRYKLLYNKNPLRDGIYSPEIYFQDGRTRICIVLKEINGTKDTNWDPVRNVRNNGSIYKSKGNIPAKAIIEIFKGTTLCQVQNIDGCDKETIPGIAYVNLSKLPGASVAIGENLKKIIKDTNDLILKQLKLIDADIYIFGGTFPFVWNIFSDSHTWPYLLQSKNTDKNINDTNLHRLSFYEYCLTDKNKMFVQIYHPSRHLELWMANTGNRIFDVYNEFVNGKLRSLKKW